MEGQGEILGGKSEKCGEREPWRMEGGEVKTTGWVVLKRRDNSIRTKSRKLKVPDRRTPGKREVPGQRLGRTR